MRLRDLMLLRALVGPEGKMSARVLARAVGCHPSFIDALKADPSKPHSRKACKPVLARRIAEVLGVPLEVLFVPKIPSNGKVSTKQRKARAA